MRSCAIISGRRSFPWMSASLPSPAAGTWTRWLRDAPLTITREWIEQHEIDLVVHGDDFTEELNELCYKTPIEMGIFRTVAYTPGISTSAIITRCKAFDLD